MKTIGLIGGISWVSTAEYYRLINQLVNEQLGGVNAAKIILHSVNYQDIKTLTEAGDWKAISVIVCEAAKKIEQAGADCIAVCANTMHKLANDIQSSVQIPFIHIAVATAEAVSAQKIDTVLLLGTRYTMLEDFYKTKLTAQGITVMIPEREDIDFINEAIYSELGKNIFLPETRQRFINVINAAVERGAKGVIFGCTEIPLLLKPEDCSVPIFDTALIHSKVMVDFAI